MLTHGNVSVCISIYMLLQVLHITFHRGVAHDKGDKPPSLKGRRPVISSIEMFLWRNYLIFTSCTAPPSTSPQTSFISTDSAGLDSSGRFQQHLNARDLFHKVHVVWNYPGSWRSKNLSQPRLQHSIDLFDVAMTTPPCTHGHPADRLLGYTLDLK